MFRADFAIPIKPYIYYFMSQDYLLPCPNFDHSHDLAVYPAARYRALRLYVCA